MCRIARLNLIVALVALAALAVATVEAPAKRGVRYRRCAPLAVAQPNGVDPRGVSPGSPNPLQGLTFFVDREEKAARQARAYQRRGRRGKAARLANLANQPKFLWFGKWTRPRMTFKVRNYLRRVQCQQPGAVPLMVVLRHQGKQCNPRYDGGGPREDARTRRWYRKFARAVGKARVVIAFEPDSLGTLECLAKSRRKARLKLLRYGVDVLSRLPNATIYLEGGASDWEPAGRMAKLLRYVGIRKVRGFMLNVTHYDWTSNNIRFGRKLSRFVGGKPFIISTSFNGRGPVHVRTRVNGRRRRLNVWCHPLKRGLGPAPTTLTGQQGVDAYLWIGRPGYSAGSCNGGPLPVGSWWPERALMFSKYATEWLSPRPGTRNGHYRHYSPRQLGYCGTRCT